MKALFLAAGFGTRLKTVAGGKPKALLDIDGQTILDRLATDVFPLVPPKDSVLVSNELFLHDFELWKRSRNQKELNIISDGARTNDTRTGAIGAIQLGLHTMGWTHEDVLILSTDTIVPVQFGALLEFFQSHRGLVNVAVDIGDREKIRNSLGEVITTDSAIVSFREKPSDPVSTVTSVPYYIYPKEIWPFVTQYHAEHKHDIRLVDPPGIIIPWLQGRFPIYAFETEGPYFDVGTPEILSEVRSLAGINPESESGQTPKERPF